METQRPRVLAVILVLHLPGGLKQVVGLSSRDSELAGLGWGPRTSIYNKFPGDAGAADPGSMLENCCVRDTGSVTLEIRRSGLL